MGSHELRAFAPSHFELWYPLWRDYQTFYKVDIADAVTRQTWERLLDPQEPMHGALAFAGDDAVGMVHFIEHRSCWTAGNYIYLQDLFVASEARGRGMGRALIEHVYGEATARGCARVYWLTHESNHDAMQLYDRIADRPGFVQYRKVLGA